MSLSSAIQWWQEWQLRILVLGSLFLHSLFPCSLFVRKLPSLSKLRVLVWIAYVGNEALAVYALATLFIRYLKRTMGGGSSRSSELELVWAPVVLVHLWGDRWITAYSLEDNELWMRHAMTVVSQVAVALYVFCKWWSGEKRLLVAAVLLFVAGILYFSQKPWALRRASFNTMQASTDLPPQRGGGGYIPSCWSWCNTTHLDNMERSIKEERENSGEKLCPESLEGYVQEAKKRVQRSVEASNPEEELSTSLFAHLKDTRKKFVDLQAAYSDRIRVLESILKLAGHHTYRMTQTFLGSIFGLLYTKTMSVSTPLGSFVATLPVFVWLASMVIFFKAPKDGYSRKDVWVTYIRFCYTALQFLLPEFIKCLLTLLRKHTITLFTWHDKVNQYNFLSFCARERRPTLLMKLVSASGDLVQYVNKHCFVSQVGEALPITKLVRGHVLIGWKQCIHDSASYRRFNNLRGQQTLWRNHQWAPMGWSLEMPFDKSVLLWHIVTSLCFYQSESSPQAAAEDGINLKYGEVARFKSKRKLQ